MKGCSRWTDNVFIERLWRSLEHGDVYLKGSMDDARIRRWATSRRSRSGVKVSPVDSARRLWT